MRLMFNFNRQEIISNIEARFEMELEPKLALLLNNFQLSHYSRMAQTFNFRNKR